ncbi:MAG: molybdenum transporter, periplasmic molybdate-binding protein, partial [Candidatus Eremiobacteraeota bacterium]|nr:molybdenum transporter, periplasmic molybdate-binding protein [Candidatus Eremiobacteraeota bacterium]
MTRLSTRAAVATAGMIAAATLTALAPATALAADKTVLVVLAASSTKAAVNDFVEKFQKKHPDVSVQASFAGSKVIAAQIKQGAAADVVLIADPVMQTMTGDVDGSTSVVRNHTTIIVSKSAAGKIHSAADLVAKGIRLGGGTPGSNIAKLTEETLAQLAKHLGADYATKYAANITTTKTDNAKLAAAVASGSVDAAILFPSDAVDGQTVEVALAAAERVEETH